MNDDYPGITDEQADEAKTALGRAIQAYCDVMHPGGYVNEWVLVTQTLTPQAMQESRDILSVIEPTGQSQHHTIGLLELGPHIRMNG